MKVLVTGGAGYIGSVTVARLDDAIVIDNLSNGNKSRVKCEFVKGDFADENLLDSILPKVDAIIHFAAFIEVEEGEREPVKFMNNNVYKSIVLLKKAVEHGVKKFVFSSSAAVYAESKVALTEDSLTVPSNTYGLTKLMFEHVLTEYANAGLIDAVSLRYFNAAGADVVNGISCESKTHLVPLVIAAALKNSSVSIFGSDYDTVDGTCERDFVHVVDLANAHIKALEFISSNKGYYVFNLGSGEVTSVRELVLAAKEVTGVNFSVVEMGRRKGDPAVLRASIEKARMILDWAPIHSHILKIISDSWLVKK